MRCRCAPCMVMLDGVSTARGARGLLQARGAVLSSEADSGWDRRRPFKRRLAMRGPRAQLALASGWVAARALPPGFLAQLRRDLVERSTRRLRPQGARGAVIAVPANANSNQRFLTLEA